MANKEHLKISPMSNLSGFFQLIRSAFDVFVDGLTFLRLTFRSPSALAAENLFLRKQLVYMLSGKRNRGGQFSSFCTRPPRQIFRLARCPHCRQARYIDPMASKGIPPVLEVEVSGEWPASSSGRRPEVDCRNGNEQSDLGTGTDRQ